MNRLFSEQAVVVNWLTMCLNSIKIKICTSVCVVALMLFCNPTNAQQLKYSRQNVFVGNPSDMQLVADVAGSHHLLNLNYDESIAIFIFDKNLQLKKKVIAPFKFPEKGVAKIIAFADFYYISFYAHLVNKSVFWKIDADGNCIELSDAFDKLLATQLPYLQHGYELKEYQGELCLLYHTYIPKLEKNVLTMVVADKALNVALTKKVMYDLKETGERLLQEQVIGDKYLLVLKTTTGGTSLRLMKVDIATGLTVSNDFYSSGFYFAQPRFTYSDQDSTTTVSAMLAESQKPHSRKNYVFASRLNHMLVEEVPYTILKNQFRKNAGTNFILLNNRTGWVRLTTSVGYSYSGFAFGDYTAEQIQGVRFSRLDNNFKIASDSLIRNNRNAYTLRPGQFTQMVMEDKDCLVLSQQFFTRRNGLLLISGGEDHILSYKQLPVIDHYNYLLHKAAVVPNEAVIIPYLHKLEAGLIRITSK
jgi:hypothetical protein